MRAPLTLRFSLEDALPIIAAEVRRVGRVPGYGVDDLKQEAAEAFVRRSKKIHPGRSRPEQAVYARRIVRSHLLDLKRGAFGPERMPLDPRGNAMEYSGVVDLRTLRAEEDPERALAAREVLRCVRAGLDADARATFIQLLEEGADACRGSRHAKVAEVRASVARILEDLSREAEERTMPKKKTKEEVLDTNALPPCHALSTAEGSTNEGYDKAEAVCFLQCAQKSSCMPAAIKQGKYKGRLQDDPEVALVEMGVVSVSQLVERATRRANAVKANGPIPADLKPEAWKDRMLQEQALSEGGATSEEETEEEDVDDVTSEEIAESETEEEDVEEEEEDESEEEDDESDDEDEEEEEDESEEEDDESDDEDEEEEEDEDDEEIEDEASDSEEATDEDSGIVDESIVDDRKHETKKSTNSTKTEEKTMSKKTAPKPAKKTSSKPAKAPKAEKAPKAAKPPKEAKAKPEKTPKEPKAPRADLDRCNGGTRTLPAERKLSPEQMEIALGNVKLGTPFDLAAGMELVRKGRDGSEIVVKLAKDGFVYDGKTYPSLTAAAMHSVGRSVNGNTMFSVVANNCTLVRGKEVPNGSYSRSGSAEAKPKGGAKKAAEKPKTEKPAKEAPAKAKTPPKKAPSKAPAKGGKKAPPPPAPKAAAPAKKSTKAAPKKAAKKASKKK